MRLRLGLAALNHMTHCWLHLSFFFPLNEAIAQWGTGAIQSGDIPIRLPDFITFSSWQRFALQSTGRRAWKKLAIKVWLLRDWELYGSTAEEQWEETAGRMHWGQADVRQMYGK